MTQQTAVDWLIKELVFLLDNGVTINVKELKYYQELANQRFEKQIKDAYALDRDYIFLKDDSDELCSQEEIQDFADQYYKEKYGKE